MGKKEIGNKKFKGYELKISEIIFVIILFYFKS